MNIGREAMRLNQFKLKFFLLLKIYPVALHPLLQLLVLLNKRLIG